jgi:regulator of replication initiation timing
MEEEKDVVERLIEVHDKYIAELEKQNEQLREKMAELEEEVDKLKEENEELKKRPPVHIPNLPQTPQQPQPYAPNTPWIPVRDNSGKDGWDNYRVTYGDNSGSYTSGSTSSTNTASSLWDGVKNIQEHQKQVEEAKKAFIKSVEERKKKQLAADIEDAMGIRHTGLDAYGNDIRDNYHG